MLHSGYQPPDGGLYVSNPRTINDIIFRSLVIRGCSIYAHVHLLHLLSWSDRFEQALVAIASTAYPELILVQLGYNAVRTILLLCQPASPPASTKAWRFYMATLIGASVSSTSHSTLALADADASDVVANARPRARLPWSIAIWALNLMPLLVTLAGYKQRLAIKYHVATFVGNLGFDHGNAWAAISGTTASMMSLVAILLNTTWSRRGDGAAEPDLDLRSSGSNGRAARRQHDASHRLLAQTVVATLIHHIPLLATNHFALLIHVWSDGWALSLLLVWALLWYIHGRTVRKGYHLRRFGLEMAVLLVLAPAVIQISSDCNELINVVHFRVERYNYRWAVKDMASARRVARCQSLTTQPCTEGSSWYYNTA